jgi:putative transposase
VVRPAAKRAQAQHLVADFDVSERRASRVAGLARSTARYKAHPRDDEPWIKEMKHEAARFRKWGVPRLLDFFRRTNRKMSKEKFERIYKKAGLTIKAKRRRTKVPAVARVPFEKAKVPNEIWSFDFVSDQTEASRKLKSLTIVDDCSKINPGILVEYSITASDVTDFFESLKKLPKKLRCDNGPEMQSKHFLAWAHARGIEIEFIEPGKPVQNAYIESFNSRFRDECLNEEIFLDLEDAKKKIEKWRRFYNEKRPHSSLAMKTPKQFEAEFNQTD